MKDFEIYFNVSGETGLAVHPATYRLTSPDATRPAHEFHCGMAGYAPTPLVSLPGQATKLGLAGLLVKDESLRFGLNAFKALGSSYAIGKYLCDKLCIAVNGEAFRNLSSPETRAALGEITFVTATDGNHGRGVAWTANLLGYKSVVYMPKGSAEERLKNILALGSQAEITPYNYDDAVRHAARMAEEKGWVLVQDTAWPGYEDIPTDILQGYTTLAWEIEQQLSQNRGDLPTHLFLQAGVGSMAGAVAGYFASTWGESRPHMVIVEPNQADCLFRSAKADDGTLHFVKGSMDSMMAGLCCGEPCTISWDIIRSCASAFISCSDSYAADGMRLLGRPESGDPAVVSGESGAVTAGVLAALMTDPQLQSYRERLGLDENSRVLLISTEGDTDQKNYLRILNDAVL